VKVEAVLSVGMTVRDMGRAVDFYSRVLSFEKVSDVEVAGTEYERLPAAYGVFCLRSSARGGPTHRGR